MAKKLGKNENGNESIDINERIRQTKKKMLTIFAVILAIIGVAGFFVGGKMIGVSKEEKERIRLELESVKIKDYVVDSKEQKIYSRDIIKQPYVLKDGIMSFEGTIVFYNKLAANLYSGTVDRSSQASIEPDMNIEVIFGDKLAKDSINKYLQNMTKKEVASAEATSKGIKNAINKQFKEIYGEEVVKSILVTTHITQ